MAGDFGTVFRTIYDKSIVWWTFFVRESPLLVKSKGEEKGKDAFRVKYSNYAKYERESAFQNYTSRGATVAKFK